MHTLRYSYSIRVPQNTSSLQELGMVLYMFFSNNYYPGTCYVEHLRVLGISRLFLTFL